MPMSFTIPAKELFNEDTGEFKILPSVEVVVEHSLYSIAKWEMKTHKSFLDNSGKMTPEEQLDYFCFMTIRPKDIEPSVYERMTAENLQAVNRYINDPMTATTFTKQKKNSGSRKGTKQGPKTITADVVYGWMVEYGIPFECEKWHFNRLLALIGVCADNRNPPKKMTQREIAQMNQSINAMNKAKYHTKG